MLQLQVVNKMNDLNKLLTEEELQLVNAWVNAGILEIYPDYFLLARREDVFMEKPITLLELVRILNERVILEALKKEYDLIKKVSSDE